MIRVEKTEVEKQQEMQRVYEYCLYMMLSSYFKAATCKSYHIEKQLFLYYKEYSTKKVYGLEEQVIRLLERQVLPLLPKEYRNETVEIRLIRNQKTNLTVIAISAEEGMFYVCGKYEGKDSELKTAWVSKEIHAVQTLTVADSNLTNQLTGQVA